MPQCLQCAHSYGNPKLGVPRVVALGILLEWDLFHPAQRMVNHRVPRQFLEKTIQCFVFNPLL